MVMTHHPDALRRRTREQLVLLVQQGGPGWHEYAIDQAKRHEREDPRVHAGLEAEVRRVIKASTSTKRSPQ